MAMASTSAHQPSSPPDIPSSPPLQAFADVASPTSSEPAIFSSDDPYHDDVTNYNTPRDKRKRFGNWWAGDARGGSGEEGEEGEDEEDEEDEGDGDATILAEGSNRPRSGRGNAGEGSEGSGGEGRGSPRPRKQRRLVKNDSGIHMPSDDADFEPKNPSKPTSTRPSDSELFRQSIVAGLDRGSTHFLFTSNDHPYARPSPWVTDAALVHMSLLNQALHIPIDPGASAPHHNSFRSLVPELRIWLTNNTLRALHPNLFKTEEVALLSLRGNNITELSPQISKLRKLAVLDLCMNNLASLPIELLDLCAPRGRLKDLRATFGNPLLPGPDGASAPYADWADEDWERVFARDLSDTPAGVARQEDDSSYRTRAATSHIAYYDADGRLLRGCAQLPTPERPWCAAYWFPTPFGFAYVRRAHAASYSSFPSGFPSAAAADVDNNDAPPTPFTPPASPTSRSAVFSLSTLSIHAALASENVTPRSLAHMFGDEVPAGLAAALPHAERNLEINYEPFLACRACGRDYVVVRAEWIEWWRDGYGEVLPFRVRVCSWACVERVHPGFAGGEKG